MENPKSEYLNNYFFSIRLERQSEISDFAVGKQTESLKKSTKPLVNEWYKKAPSSFDLANTGPTESYCHVYSQS